jgi:ABC-2 type transport system permease protein
VITNLEYRLNYLIDAVAQPIVTSCIEVTLWFALFKSAGTAQINGFGLNAYLAYAIWASFVSRITATWMYEFKMAEEIDSGSINGLLVRPFSFFEYYMSQFLGYKVVTTAVSVLVPLLASWIFDLQVNWARVPGALALTLYYLIFVQTLSFIIASLAFHLNRTHAFTVAKNLALALFSGELVPLDLFPAKIKTALLWLPFANAAYIPVGYLTGRFGNEIFWQGWITSTLGTVVAAAVAVFAWKKGVAKYAGTGA